MSAVARRRWYQGGFPALRVADKKIQDVRRRAERAELARRNRSSPTKRSRSLSRGRISRSKSIYFEDSDDDIPYYRSKSVTANDRRGSTFTPVVNEDDVIHQTYTGEDSRPSTRLNIKSRAKSRSRRHSGIIHKTVENVVPHRRDSYQINKLQENTFKNIQKTYGESTFTANHSFLYDKLAQVKLEHYKMRYLKLKETDKTVLDDKFQQLTRLKHIAKRYEKEARRCLASQQNSNSSIDEKFRRLSQYDPNTDEMNKGNTKRRINATPRQKVMVANPIKDKYLPLLDRYEKKKRDKQAAEEPDDVKHLIKVAEQMLSLYDKGKKESEKSKDHTKEKQDIYIPSDSPGDSTDSMKKSKTTPNSSLAKLNHINSTKQLNPGAESHQRRLSKTRKNNSKLIKRRSSNPSPWFSTFDNVESKPRNRNEADASSTQTKSVSEVQTIESSNIRTSDSSVFTNDSTMRTDVTKKKRLKKVNSRESIHSTRTHSRPIIFKTQMGDDKNNTLDSKIALNIHEVTETVTEFNARDNEPMSQRGHNSTILIQNMSDVDAENRNIQEAKRPSYLERLSNKKNLRNFKPKGTRQSSSSGSTKNTSSNISGYDYAMPMDEFEHRRDNRSPSRVNELSNKRRVSVSKKSKNRSISREKRTSKTPKGLSDVDARHNEVDNSYQTVTNERREINTNCTEHDEQTEYTIKQDAKDKSSTNYSVTTAHTTVTDEKESEHQELIKKTVSSSRMGAGRWKSLVEKYIRQPSPKIGHSEHRKIIETVESDDDDDMDIFERAKQRYNLNVNSDEDDNEDDSSDIS